MPLFEYRCSECQHLEEVLQKYDDPPPAECEKCGKKKTMSREVSLTSFQLKGGGWYKDLYSSTKPDASGKDGSSGTKGDGGSDGKSGGSEKGSKSDKKSGGKSEKKSAGKSDKKPSKSTSSSKAAA